MELVHSLRFVLRLLFHGLPAERVLASTFARMLEYCVVPVPEEILRRLVPPGSLNVDISTCVFVPAFAWGLEPRWLQVRGRRGTGVLRAVGVMGLRTCLASETTVFNLSSRLTDGEPRLRLTALLTWTPTVAAAATIALVSGSNVERETLDLALATYFSTPRWVTLGDLLLIDMCSLVPSLRFSQPHAGPVYVRITELDPAEPSFILKDTTAISQGPDCNGWLPPSIVTTTKEGVVLPRCPAGLEECLADLKGGVGASLRGGVLPVKPAFLVTGPRGSGKTQLVDSLAKSLGVPLLRGDCTQLRGASPRAAEQRLAALVSRARAPCLLCLRRVDALARSDGGTEADPRRVATFRDVLASIAPGCVVVALATLDGDDNTALPPALTRCFLRSTRIPHLDVAARTASLRWLVLRNGGTYAGLDVSAVASASAGYVLGDLQALVAQAQRLAYLRARSERQAARTAQADFDKALEILGKRMASASGAPQVAKVTWADVGGLGHAKTEIQRLLDPPPALAKAGLRRAGVLLFGPPGGGKTLLAKAAANAGQRCFLSVKGPELLSAYVGQSERAVRDVFARARAAQPCLVFLDELDALAPLRGRSGDSAGVMDRVVSQLLSEMDGMHSQADVVVMAATNRPDLIDPALMRPGRLDKLIYVGACESRADRLAVLTALTRRMSLAPGVSLLDVVAALDTPPERGGVSAALTGADLMALATAAWNLAARRTVLRIQAGKDPLQESTGVQVGVEDFAMAAQALGPSVSAEDLAYFQQLHRKLTVAR